MAVTRPLHDRYAGVDVLLDWYLSLASLLKRSEEPLLDEAQLRMRIESMLSASRPEQPERERPSARGPVIQSDRL